jgi:hypothetical protein
VTTEKKYQYIKGNKQKKKQIDLIPGADNQQGIQSKTNEQVVKLVRNSRKYQKEATGNNKKGRSNWQKHVGKTCRPSGSTYHWVSGLLVGLRGQRRQNITQSIFISVLSISLGIRQGARCQNSRVTWMEAVASPWSSSQLGGQIPILPRIRFLFH